MLNVVDFKWTGSLQLLLLTTVEQQLREGAICSSCFFLRTMTSHNQRAPEVEAWSGCDIYESSQAQISLLPCDFL